MNNNTQKLTLLKTILQLNPNTTLTVDKQNTIQTINNQTNQLFNYPPKKLKKTPIEMLIPKNLHTIHTTQHTRFNQTPQLQPINTKLNLYKRRKNKWQFPININLTPLPIKNRPTLIITAIQNITKLQQQKQLTTRLTILIQSTNVTILSTNILQIINN